MIEAPPSTSEAVPVTKDESSDARYSTERASSSGRAGRFSACRPVMMDVQTGSPACAYSPVAPAAEHEFGTVGGCWPLSSARENLLLTRRPLWLRSWLSRRRAQTRSLAGGWGAGGTIGEAKPDRAAHHLHARPGRHGRTRDVSGDRDGSLACGSVAVAFEGHQRSANCLRLPSVCLDWWGGGLG